MKIDCQIHYLSHRNRFKDHLKSAGGKNPAPTKSIAHYGKAGNGLATEYDREASILCEGIAVSGGAGR
jgi:hypothetical protein